MAKRAGISQKAAEEQIKYLEKLGLVKQGKPVQLVAGAGKRRLEKQKETAWMYDHSHKYAAAVAKFVHEVSPVEYDRVVKVLKRSGKPTAVILSGCFVGDPSRPADLIVAADSLNERLLEQAVKQLEPTMGREIRYAAFSTPEFRYRLTVQDRLLRDTLDFPHLILLDKTRLL
jgi:hypothetical protein